MYYVSICAPMFIWFIGIVIAIVRWRHSPRSSAFAVGGLLAMLLSGLDELIRYGITMSVPQFQITYLPILLRVMIYGEIFFEILGAILILLAIFTPARKVNQSES